MKPALQQYYQDTVIPALKAEFGYRNVMQVPKVTKVVLNVGYGRHTKDNAHIENLERTLSQVTGQKPVHNKAKKAISNFKTRVGMPIGASVTLRGRSMYEFLYKLIHLTFPRVRDFRGISPKGFDHHGNYTVGLKENIAFPEIGGGSLERLHGLEITVVTTAKNDQESKMLLTQLGFPFKAK